MDILYSNEHSRTTYSELAKHATSCICRLYFSAHARSIHSRARPNVHRFTGLRVQGHMRPDCLLWHAVWLAYNTGVYSRA